MIYYHATSIEENERIYGPGKRFVMWTQGCSIRCKGCNNSHLFDRTGAKTISSDELIAKFFNTDGLEGITLLGGEPSDQIDELLPFMLAAKNNGFSIITFTGREIETFQLKKERAFISLSDIVICGPYIKEKQNLYLQYRGSDNQRVIYISERYKDNCLKDGYNSILLELSDDGIIINKGFPDESIEHLIEDLSSRMEYQNDS